MRMQRALGELVISGVPTTTVYHNMILEIEDFVNGNVDTGFIPSHQAELSEPPPPREARPLFVLSQPAVPTHACATINCGGCAVAKAGSTSLKTLLSWLRAGLQHCGEGRQEGAQAHQEAGARRLRARMHDGGTDCRVLGVERARAVFMRERKFLKGAVTWT
jgi:acetyl/propionyl-CoA carboxylase alpha subunit